jgi:ribonuclease HII
VALLRLERVLWSRGLRYVAGVDEAGRGPLAGPVVAAAVVLPPDVDLAGVNDSKQLSEKQREAAYELICARAVAYGIGVVDVPRIEEINILWAALEAMQKALDQVATTVTPDYVLVDGNRTIPSYAGRQRPIVGGDRRSLSVAAASILAKVTRDRLALEWDREYPQYGFARHKGYSTPQHWAALREHGPCPLHRPSFLGRLRQQQLEFDLG